MPQRGNSTLSFAAPVQHVPCSTSFAAPMAWRVDLTTRTDRDLTRLYGVIDAPNSPEARAWFAGLEQAILSLDQNPARNPTIAEDATLRHLLYGRRRNVYRVIYAIDEPDKLVTVVHIRHGARDALVAQGDG